MIDFSKYTLEITIIVINILLFLFILRVKNAIAEDDRLNDEADRLEDEELDNLYSEKEAKSNQRGLFSQDRFDKTAHEEKNDDSILRFEEGLKSAQSNDEVLKLLKTILKEQFDLRWEYHSTNSSSKDELYNESEVMPWAIEKLQTFEEEESLIKYCAILLDFYNKDREYDYGLREEQMYKLRYIHGSVQGIVEQYINELEKYDVTILTQIEIAKDEVEKNNKTRI